MRKIILTIILISFHSYAYNIDVEILMAKKQIEKAKDFNQKKLHAAKLQGKIAEEMLDVSPEKRDEQMYLIELDNAFTQVDFATLTKKECKYRKQDLLRSELIDGQIKLTKEANVALATLEQVCGTF